MGDKTKEFYPVFCLEPLILKAYGFLQIYHCVCVKIGFFFIVQNKVLLYI